MCVQFSILQSNEHLVIMVHIFQEHNNKELFVIHNFIVKKGKQWLVLNEETPVDKIIPKKTSAIIYEAGEHDLFSIMS